MTEQLLIWLVLAGGWGEFGSSTIWDQGVAEVALYKVEGRLEGAPRSYEAVTVLVKEPFDLDRHVKAAAGAERSVEVLKFNHEVTVPTGIYTYRQMASVFLRRQDLQPLKLAVASQELCGLTSKLWRSDTARRLRTQSYFDGEGDRDFGLDYSDGTLFYDALPVSLRGMEPRPEPLEIRLVPPQISSRAPKPVVAEATLRWGETERVETPVGRFEARRVVVEHAGGRDVFLFQQDFPHILVGWRQANGTHYRLHNLKRLAYWNHTRQGDRRLLEEPDPIRSIAIPSGR